MDVYQGQAKIRETRNGVAVTLRPKYLLRDALMVMSEHCDWAVDLEDPDPYVQDGTASVTLKWTQPTSMCEHESLALRGMLRAFNSQYARDRYELFQPIPGRYLIAPADKKYVSPLSQFIEVKQMPLWGDEALFGITRAISTPEVRVQYGGAYGMPDMGLHKTFLRVARGSTSARHKLLDVLQSSSAACNETYVLARVETTNSYELDIQPVCSGFRFTL
jgi:hypothetical protein